MIRRALIALLAGLALAGPAAAADYNQAYPQFPADRAPKTCAAWQMHRQIDWMRSRSWQVQVPVLRTFTQGAFFGDTVLYDEAATVINGVTFVWDGRWVLIVSPETERGLCAANRIIRRNDATTPLDEDYAIDTMFHELLHQTWGMQNEPDQGHALVVPRAARMTRVYVGAYERARAARARAYYRTSERRAGLYAG
jgi:hypothetical protein